MSRLTGGVLALLCSLSPAHATLARPEHAALPNDLRPGLAKGLDPKTEAVPPPAEAALAADTEVFLNDGPCYYRAVPTTASITRIVLAPDGRTVVQIEFRTTK